MAIPTILLELKKTTFDEVLTLFLTYFSEMPYDSVIINYHAKIMLLSVEV